MKTKFAAILTLALPGAAALGQPVMYAIDSVSDVMVTINLSTGAATPVGPIGFNGGIWGLAFSTAPTPGPGGTTHPAGTLFGVEVATQRLYTLNTSTGLATPIGPTFLLGVWETLTFDAAGNLWTTEVYDRFLLNTATGLATHVPGGLNVPTGVLYSLDLLPVAVPMMGSGTVPAGSLIGCKAGMFYALDGVTWDVLHAAPIPGAEEVVAAAADGTIYAIGGPFGNNRLFRLDPATGTSTLIGSTGLGAVYGGAIIPAPATIGAGAAVGAIGVTRRRR